MFLLLPIIAGLPAVGSRQMPAAPPTFRAWGQDAIQQIQTAFWLPERNLYAEEKTVGQPTPDKPAFMWGWGVQLAALAAGARLNRADIPPLRRAISGMEPYWSEAGGVWGYAVQPHQEAPDRFYDDNAWVALALTESYEVTRDPQMLDRAERTFQFVLSGEDTRLGGGIYWHEKERTSKNACSNAPAAAAALRLYQITKQESYLTVARRLYDWTYAHLQDTDGLFFDRIEMDGKVEKTKWSYNSALMIRTNSLFYAVTRKKKYLLEAQRIAHAAEARWIDKTTGGIADIAPFAYLLSESFLTLANQDHDPHWTELVRRALTFLHDKVRDPNGFYGERWATPQPTAQQKITLLSQASAARAFLVAAPYLDTMPQTASP